MTELVRVVLVDDHHVVRHGLRTYLESFTDLEVVGEAASGEEAVEKLAREQVDIVVASLDLAIPGGDLAGRLRKTQGCARLPVLYLANSPAEVPAPAESELEDYQIKFDREAMLRSVERLVSALHGGQKAAGSTVKLPWPSDVQRQPSRSPALRLKTSIGTICPSNRARDMFFTIA